MTIEGINNNPKNKLPILGIIGGNGDLPAEIYRIYTKNHGKCFIASIDQGQIYPTENHQYFELGRVGAIIKYFQKNKVENIIMIGGLKRPDLTSLKMDLAGTALMSTIFKNKLLGDDNILRIIGQYLEKKGFKIISPQSVLALSEPGNMSCNLEKISARDKQDIKIGQEILTRIGNYDIGQSIIVCDGYVLGIEAAEGTDALITRCQKLRKSKKGGVLVKMAKKTQDLRLDTPAIGPKTIELLQENNFNGIAIEEHKVIIAKPLLVQEKLNKYDLFLEKIT